MAMFLNHEQMCELTGFERYSVQVRALRTMGIDHFVRRDGRPLVMYEKLLNSQHHTRSSKKNEPDWNQVNATAKT